jgi:predicted PurR-regulated permease PerM
MRNNGDIWGFDHRRITLLLFAVLVAVVVWHAVDVLLLTFAAVLVAVALRSLAAWLSTHTGMRVGSALSVVVVVLATCLIALLILFGERFAAEADEIVEASRQGLSSVQNWLNGYEWGRWLLKSGEQSLKGLSSIMLTSASGAFSGVIWIVGSLLFLLFVGIYLAFSPDVYANGLIRMLPREWQNPARSVGHSMVDNLKWWLLGRFISMIIVGGLTTIGLLILGVPLPYTLGTIAGALNFIPNVGPILSLVPAAFLALTISPLSAAYVTVLYLLVQMLESYLITPNIDRTFVSIPPALIIVVQVFLAVMVGLLGMALATPLLVVISVALDARNAPDRSA